VLEKKKSKNSSPPGARIVEFSSEIKNGKLFGLTPNNLVG